MTFKDIFKSSFLEKVTTISPLDMVIALFLAFALGLFIYLVYKRHSRASCIQRALAYACLQ